MGFKVAYAIGIMGEVLSWGMLTWFLPPQNGFMRFLSILLDPIVHPFRILLNKMIRKPMMLDLAPFLAMVALSYVIVPALQMFALNLFK